MHFRIVVLMMLICNGCGSIDSAGATQKANVIKAKSLLKAYQVAQNVFRTESDGRYGTLSELAARQQINDELAQAADKQAKPVPVDGYLFADIEQDSGGQPLERHSKAGVCAYPQDGKGAVILMLLDTKDPEEWAFYTAESADAGGAVRRWPSADDLKNKFARSGKYAPEQGAKEAEKLAK